LSDPRPNVCLEELFMLMMVFEHIFEYKTCFRPPHIRALRYTRQGGNSVISRCETIAS